MPAKPPGLGDLPNLNVLTITSAGTPVSTVAAKTVVTLTATVKAGSAPVSPGQVNFCDATGKLCSDIHLLGTAQLSASGTATMKFTPGPGTHSYRAVFAGTNSAQSSSSTVLSLSVTGVVLGPSSISISAGGGAGRYTLGSTVMGSGYPVSPTGTISFIDTSYGNSVLATAPLVQGAPSAGLNFVLSYASLAIPSGPGSLMNDVPTQIVLADFNGDGKLDVALTEENVASTPVSVYLGNGDGTMTLAPPIPILAPEGSESIAVADFNGDGVPDLVVNLYDPVGQPPGTPLNELQVLLGKGDGTFTLGQVIATPDPTAIATGDFNGDGVLDLVLATFGSYSTPGSVVVLLGRGDGTFTAASGATATGIEPNAIVAGDFNQDGKTDVAITNAVSHDVTILLGNGDGTFTPSPVSPQTGDDPITIVAADFNKDGILDLAVLNYFNTTGAPPDITILLGDGDGTFTPGPNVPAPFDGTAHSLTVGDFNGDGNVDLAVAPESDSVGDFGIALGKGDGTFGPAQTLPACSSLHCVSNVVAAGDFNGDGLSDLASDLYNFSYEVSSGNGSIDLATVSVDTSAATSPLITLPPGSGTHLVYASYPGDGTFPADISGLVALVADPVASTTTLSATPQTIYLGQRIALSATVSPAVVFGNSATGRVIFSSGANGLGKATGTGVFALNTGPL